MAQATKGRPSPQVVTRDLLDEAIEATLSKERVTWKADGNGEELVLGISHVRKLFANPTKEGRLPTDRDCWLFLQMCKAAGLNPYVKDAYLLGYDDNREPSGAKWSLIVAHQSLLKRAEASGQYDGMESGVILVDRQTGEVSEPEGDFYLATTHELVGGWCVAYRKDRSRHKRERVALATFNKKRSRWNDDAAGMIVKCAEASAHRLAFPRETGGLYIREEIDHAKRDDTPERASARKTIDDLTSQLSSRQQVARPAASEPIDGPHAEDASQVEPDLESLPEPERPHISPDREKQTRPKKRETAPDGQELPESLFGNQPDAQEAGY